MNYSAWVAKSTNQPLVREPLIVGPLGDEEVEVAVEHCGVCHSDLSVLKNDWGISKYPAVLGHEVTGRITALGSSSKGLELGMRVGVSCISSSCMHCRQCMAGSHQLCAQAQLTVVGRHGGFATHVRAHWAWVIPLPEGLSSAEAGPLLCGGVTMFSPLTLYVTPSARVGIVGIGGLGHLGLKFAAAYGCEVTALTSNPSKFEEAKRFGAHHVVSTADAASLGKLRESFDLIISTVNVTRNWDALIDTLAPKGRLHLVGAVLDRIPVAAFSLISRQRNLSGSLIGSPSAIRATLEFAARHGIAPENEHFPMSQINEAFARLDEGNARYRIVLDADF